MPIIPALGSMRQEDLDFEVSLGYTVRCLKQTSKQNSLYLLKESELPSLKILIKLIKL
jgi:hypothetical protein